MNDEEWLNDWLPRLCRDAKSGDTYALHSTLSEADARPGCKGYMRMATNLLDAFRDQLSEAKAIKAICESVLALGTTRVDMYIAGNVNASGGAVVGGDSSSQKTIARV